MSLDWLNIYIEEIDSLIRASRKFIRREGIQGIIVFAGGVGPRPIFSYCNFTIYGTLKSLDSPRRFRPNLYLFKYTIIITINVKTMPNNAPKYVMLSKSI